MVKFFRRIRLKLLSEGQLRKYIFYAIGEVLLVMLGILLALQVNNWNEYKKERVKEMEILMALIKNLEINIQTLESDITLLHKLSMSSNIILSVLDEKLPYSDSLDIHFHNARVPKNELFISQAGYEQYKNVGFNIITNERVKDEVLTLFESTYPKTLVVYDQVNATYVPFIDHLVPLFRYHSGEGDTHYLKPIDFPKIQNDHYYIGWTRAYKEGRNTLVKMETSLLSETKRILQIIENEVYQH